MASTIDLDLNPDKEYEIVAGQAEEKTIGGARHGGVGVEIISPHDLYERVIDSPTRTTILTDTDDLVTEGLLPGFRCRITDLFRSPSGLSA